MRLRIGILILCLLLGSAYGCGRADSGQMAVKAGISVEVKTVPEVPQADRPTTFQVSLTENGQPVEKASVSLHLEMQEMDHGDNEVKMQENAPGMYKGEGAFPMSGTWVAHIRVKRDQGTESTHVKLNVSD
ncbi:FixH family protein [Tumebacillus lipolyticus]|uniref:FixH family protein n=1 Tax=Tumebacillus lipolyticus TaxID=1280370 RepID=A0ABW5A141_9BACL